MQKLAMSPIATPHQSGATKTAVTINAQVAV